ncbi:MAG: hypothetical protein ACRDGM_08975, partial [bacterium]
TGDMGSVDMWSGFYILTIVTGVWKRGADLGILTIVFSLLCAERGGARASGLPTIVLRFERRK